MEMKFLVFYPLSFFLTSLCHAQLCPPASSNENIIATFANYEQCSAATPNAFEKRLVGALRVSSHFVKKDQPAPGEVPGSAIRSKEDLLKESLIRVRRELAVKKKGG
jgi:hypothetical protein